VLQAIDFVAAHCPASQANERMLDATSKLRVAPGERKA